MEHSLTTLDHGVTVVTLHGKLNMASAGQLRDIARDVIASGSAKLSIDFADVDFIDSTGLGALIGSLKSARDAGGDVRISRLGDQVALVLKLTGMTGVFPAHEDPLTAFSHE